MMLNSTARDLAIDRAKCLYREWTLIGRTEEKVDEMAKAKREERERYEFLILALENKLYAEQQRCDRMKPLWTFGKVCLGGAIVFGGVKAYKAVR